ncbi:FUSC family protein [Herbidospora daliensis]|uniref:FUSC family protein n=1 Tax=Herbidospora daliensis TaxID=295585 RepID=UPI001E641DD6|nr:FUSC family protein [Herbidospora daliensis]
MLILQFGTGPAAADRIVETLIGAAVGLVTVFVATPARLRPAEQAIAAFGGRVAALLDDMAAGLAAEPAPEAVARWTDRARRLTAEILRVEAEVDTADETARLRGRTGTGHSRALREALDTLERAIPTVRGLARCISDRTGLRMWEPEVRERLAGVLHDLAQTTRNYAEAATTCCPEEAERLTGELDRSLAEGRRLRDELGAVLRNDPGHWPLHGELLVHLDRLLDGLRDGPVVSRAAGRADRVRARATLRV